MSRSRSKASANFAATLRPSMQDEIPATFRVHTTPRKGVAVAISSPSTGTPISLLAQTPPRASRGGGLSTCGENRPPYNSPPRSMHDASFSSSPDSTALDLSPMRTRSNSPLERLRTSPSSHDAGTGVLISHVSQLRSALRAAYGKLDILEHERAALKEQLAEVVSDAGKCACVYTCTHRQMCAYV